MKEFYQEADSLDEKKFSDLVGVIVEVQIDALRKEMKTELENIKSQKHNCRFDISDGEAKEFTLAISMISSLGGGNGFIPGLQVMWDNHKWMKSQRDKTKAISSVFYTVAITAIVTGVATAIWQGIKAALNK